MIDALMLELGRIDAELKALTRKRNEVRQELAEAACPFKIGDIITSTDPCVLFGGIFEIVGIRYYEFSTYLMTGKVPGQDITHDLPHWTIWEVKDG